MEKTKKPIIQKFIDPIMPEFKIKDVLQIIIGASILAVPVGFTEETWRLGESLPIINIIGLLALSIFFISIFTYHHYKSPTKQWNHHTKRILSTYTFSFIVVAVILGLIQRTPWTTDSILALKRVIIVTFPSSMSAVVADTLK